MADELTSIQGQIVGKDKAAIEALIGSPLKVGYWTNARPPDGADSATITAFEAAQLDEIWIYSNGRVHFSIAGKALKVDDNISHDLPPEQGPTLFA